MSERAEFIKMTVSLVTTAFAVCSGLAWNQTVLSIFKMLLGDPNNVVANLMYAGVVTVVSIVAIVYIARIASRVTGEEIKPHV